MSDVPVLLHEIISIIIRRGTAYGDSAYNKEYQSEVLSFSSYFEKFKNDPERELRPTCKYLLDMINFFGKTEEKYFKLFSMNNPDSPAVFGQQAPQQSILDNLINFWLVHICSDISIPTQLEEQTVGFIRFQMTDISVIERSMTDD